MFLQRLWIEQVTKHFLGEMAETKKISQNWRMATQEQTTIGILGYVFLTTRFLVQ